MNLNKNKSNNMQVFKNRFNGHRCFLIGNGPSLEHTPLEMLANEYTFGVNQISLIYSHTEWRPTFYVTNSRTNQNNLSRYKESVKLGIPSFVPEDVADLYHSYDNIYTREKRSIKAKNSGKFENRELDEYWSTDATQVYKNKTIMYETLQIAKYMGFDPIYFVGCDLGYKPMVSPTIFDVEPKFEEFYRNNKNTYPYKPKLFIDYILSSDKPGQGFLNVISYILIYKTPIIQILNRRFNFLIDENHFSERYKLNPEKHLISIANEMNQAHELMELVSERVGFELYNATIGGELEAHERVDLHSVLNN